ncbi:ABC transporter substrate-binding protein [Paenibacillus anseongense]|uniref:ABC transporter substrate-binding protein n=1 Tax=Paenibacillus TaxID=44249 RepID=UPI002DBB30E1|nr:extracellular solute-binding protein [Paenibacillus anseongense]MEC0267322.1 extracellular solute-binding protein [Paenibacillus anseongense]
MNKWYKGSIAVMLTASMLLTGCAAKNDTAVVKTDKKAVKLVVWGAVPEETGPKTVVEKWNKEHPDIQVEYVRYINDDSGNTKLDTALMTQSDAPDIFFSYGENNLYRRENAGMTVPLDDMIKKENFEVDGVIGNNNVLKYKDQYHYLPAYKNVDFVVLNKKALDEAGEKVPTDWTWDDYLTLAGKLNKGDRKGSFITPGADLLIGKFTLVSSQPKDSFYKQDGLSNFNHPAMKKGLEIQKALYDKGYMVGWGEGLANKLDPANELLTGKASMVYGGAWMMRSLKDKTKWPRDFSVAFAPAPQYEKGTNVNNGGMNDFMSINKNSANKDAAFKFISWYLTEGNMDMVPGGRIPTNKKADMTQVTQMIVGDNKDIIDQDSLANVLKANYTFAVREKAVAFPQITSITKEEAEKYFMNQQSIDKTLETMQKRADQAIQADKK